MILGNILFFFMMFAPRAWQFLKMPLVVVAAFLLIFHFIRGNKTNLNHIVARWFTILLSFGVIWSLIGALKGNPGCFEFFRINVIWVIIYGLFVMYIDTVEKFNRLIIAMVWAAMAISLYNICITLSALDIIPNINSILHIDSDVTSGVGIYDYAGFIQLSSHNIGSLTFLTPFLMSFIIMKRNISGTSGKLLLVAVVLSIIAVLISGRRALWLDMMLTPVLILVFNYFNAYKCDAATTKYVLKFYLITVSFLFVAGYFLMAYSDWSFAAMQERFTSAFTTEEVRQQQAAALWRGFINSPLIGSGFGIGVPDVVRDEVHPWNYELSYMLTLYNTGLLGSLIYLLCLGMIYYYGFTLMSNRLCDESIMLSLLIAFTCFIIANATNPYFQSYDFMWVLFLPVCYINIIMNNHDKKNV